VTAPAAISASLVNMRNVGTHKSVALTIHVPEELAAQVIEAFGWPTMANPVSVAVARLRDAETDSRTNPLGTPEAARGSRSSVTPHNSEPKERKAWADLPPSQQAAIRCSEAEFTRWLWSAHYEREDADAAATVRRLCGVKSRADLNANHRARMVWFGLDTEYMQATGRLARSA
jgi:hypothetical protein